MIRLAFANLIQHPTRTALSVLGVALEVSLVLVLIGLATGTLKEAGERIENIKADLIVLPPGAHFMLGMSTAVMPLEPVRAAIQSHQDVLGAAPVVFTSTNAFGSFGLVFGIEPDSYALAGRGSLDLVVGEPLSGADDMLVDARLAEAKRLKVGTTVDVLNHTFRLSGIARDGAGVRMYLPIATLQDLLGRQGKASVFFVRVVSPERIGPVLEHLRSLPAFKGYSVFPSSQYTDLLASNTVGIKQFNAAITIIAMAFGFVVIALSMYTTILERTRQIGILKSMGASNLFVLREVLLESTFLSALGIPAGIGLAFCIKSWLRMAYPTLIVQFAPQWMLYATLIALVSGILGSLYPALRASTVDPVVALNYE